MRLMHAHPVEQGGLEEQATTLSIHLSLIPSPCSQSPQPRKIEVMAKDSQPAPVRLSFFPQLSETDVHLGWGLMGDK